MTFRLAADGDARQILRSAVAHAAHLLPMQGPIGVFIHHNTLHAFQHLPFEEAVTKAAELFGAQPYMTEDQYRVALRRGRILPEDLINVLLQEPNAPVLNGMDRRILRRLLLTQGEKQYRPETLEWELAEGDFSRDSKLRALFKAFTERGLQHADMYQQPPQRPRDGILASTGIDLDDVVHPLLIRLCGGFLDQGMAYWPMPDRDGGFYNCVRDLLRRGGGASPKELAGLQDEFRSQHAARLTAEQVLLLCLEVLGIQPREFDAVIQAECLALPGWTGLMRRLEEEPELTPHEPVRCSLVDFLAVRMTTTLVAARSVLAPRNSSAAAWRVSAPPDHDSQALLQAAELAAAARLCDLTADDVRNLPKLLLERFEVEVLSFTSAGRRRIFQLAYELRHQHQILDPLHQFRRRSGPPRDPVNPSAQVFFCIDEREESIRRHLEETAPDVETFAAAGFFGVAVNYAGIDDAHGVALCPVVVKPQHAVREMPHPEDRDVYERRKALRSLWARVARAGFVSSRTLVRGAISTAVLGFFSLFPLITHVLTPRRYGAITRALNKWIFPEPRTEVTLMRADETGHAATENLLLGFTLEEKADRVASVLGPAGLIARFAPVVVVLGHGSTSLNNPHESAHDCGACGGRRGGPNARLFAAMANHPGVRDLLDSRGIRIPKTTWFVGGYHDTCSDEIEYFDLEAIPRTHTGAFTEVERKLEVARTLDAHERSRRFEAAGSKLSPEAALRHVQERSEHLAGPRPEYGHCTNAVCIVGRRALTRGLFFDRRAFLVSYDPTIDPDGSSLGRVLGAAMPVCAGISLEYYFSFVDNEKYGCGTKLPHNITGLIGVMNGAASDLRTGLPWQMVEIHEPVRILFVIESDPAVLSRTIGANALLNELVANRWVRLTAVHPDTGEIFVWRDDQFEHYLPEVIPLPHAPTSVHWYSGKREHLPVAQIGSLQDVA